MKGDQIGTLTAHPSLQELSLSNWTWFNPATLALMGQAAGAGPLAPGQRWSLARKHEVVLRLLRGEPVEAVSRQFGVPVWQLERWRARALAGLKAGLRERS